MSSKISKSLYIIFGLVVSGIYACALANDCSAFTGSFNTATNTFAALTAGGLPEPYSSVFPQNNIANWNPCEGGVNNPDLTGLCFEIDESVGAQDYWYPEGCIDNGTCNSGIYFEGSEETLRLVINNRDVLWDSSNGRFKDDVIKTDDDFGGLQYIYAENYDFEYNSSETKLTPNGGNSTRKYYWIALPDSAYSNGFGETYVATFEKMDEPVYFIVFDVHACGDQGERYCDRALADPNGVKIGGEFFGALSKNGGNSTEVENKTGKLKSFCRINGTGEVLVHGSENSDPSISGSSSSDSSDSSSSSKSSSVSYKGDYPEYLQGSIPWNDDDYGGCSIARCGCGPSSMAMLATVSANKDIYPNDIAALTKSAGYYWDTVGDGMVKLDKIVGDKYGFDVKEVQVNEGDLNDVESKMKQYLNDGYMIHLSGMGSTPFSSDGHYVGIFNINGDKVMVADSSNGNKEYSLRDLLNAGYHGNAFSAISGGKCFNYDGDYPQYYQSGESWSGEPYDNAIISDRTIGKCGCGPTSMAMLATVAAGKDIYPQEIAAITNNGSKWGENYVHAMWHSAYELDKKVADKYGFEVVEVPYNNRKEAIDKMRQYLKNGYMIHTSGKGPKPFSESGHYIGIYDIDNNDVVTTANPAKNRGLKWDLTELVNAGVHMPTKSTDKASFTAIRKPNKCNNEEDDAVCPADGDDSSGIQDGGFSSVEKADKVIMDPYRELFGHPELWKSEYHLTSDAGPDNCFSFTQYFISMYTTIDFKGVGGDGGALADNFYNEYHDKYPKLKKSKTPVAYGVASCGDAVYTKDNYSHTFIILGVNGNKMIIGEAGYQSGLDYTRAKEFSVTDSGDAAHNGSGDIPCTFIDINAYIKGV